MGYIREPKNVDLIVGPSVFTDDTKHTIANAIALYKKTGQKPASLSIRVNTQGSSNITTRVSRTKADNTNSNQIVRKKAKM
jgi:hypothetical protein